MIGDGLRMPSLLARRMGRGSREVPHLGGWSEVQGRDQENVGTSGIGRCGLRGTLGVDPGRFWVCGGWIQDGSWVSCLRAK